ncbi:hypothetical protein [Streptomyces sp900116325]|uniref:hypothetical protein n=1 Tax=Streptomyces sp. 900116325 TaxID=3154295 RepID=UPI0033FCD1F0
MTDKPSRWHSNPWWDAVWGAALTVFSITNDDKVIRFLVTTAAVVQAFNLGRRTQRQKSRP